MVLLKAAPRRAAGYAVIDIGAAAIRISLPDEVVRSRARALTDKGTTSQEANGDGPDEAVAATQGALDARQEDEPSSDGLPSVHTTTRAGARVTSATAARLPANPDEPLHSMPNFIARGRVRSSGAAAGRRVYVADQLTEECRDFSGLQLRSPFERGLLTDWVAQKVILDRAIDVALDERDLAPRQAQPYTPALATKSAKAMGVAPEDISTFDFGADLESRMLEERTVIVTEPYFNLPVSSATADAMLFEQYGAAAIWRSTPAQLVPFAPIFQHAASERTDRFDPMTANTTGLPVPDCLLVIDLGHSSTHVVPLICAQAQWTAARRLDIGGKLLTNLLKETLSFRHLDLRDETWLTQAIKERCCFLAAASGTLGTSAVDAGEDDDIPSLDTRRSALVSVGSEPDLVRRRRQQVLYLLRTQRPSRWGLALLVELCKLFPASNPIAQEYVLPSYTETDGCGEGGGRAALRFDGRRDLGYIRRTTRSTFSEGTSATTGQQATLSGTKEDQHIADMSRLFDSRHKPEAGPPTAGSFAQDMDVQDDIDEDSDDEDFDPEREPVLPSDGSDMDESGSDATEEHRRRTAVDDEDDEDHVLKLTSERFCVPEVLFAPDRIGLAQAPLHDIVADAIRACPEDVRDMMWSNIVLIGGGAKMPGLCRRLEHELRSLAPDDIPIHVWESAEPDKVAAQGALALLRAPLQSPESRFFRAHLVTQTEWAKASPAVCQARYGGWMAMHDIGDHLRRDELSEDEEEDEHDDDGDESSSSSESPRPPKRFGQTTRSSAGPTSAVGEASSAPPPKKPRGRPKGTKNKPKEPSAMVAINVP